MALKNLTIFSNNNIHPSIQFTMEVETTGKIACLDVLVTRKGDKLGHRVYRKLTQTL